MFHARCLKHLHFQFLEFHAEGPKLESILDVQVLDKCRLVDYL